MSINRAIILGRLGKDPELKYTSTGLAICTFSLATSERWKDKQNKAQERTEWHKLIVFGKQAENCGQYLNKGSLVFVEGKLCTRKYEDKKSIERYITEIHVNSIQFLSGYKNSEQVDKIKNVMAKDEIPEVNSFDELNVQLGTQFESDDIPF